MPYKAIAKLENGVFVDFETINRLIDNIVDTRQEVPYMRHTSLNKGSVDNVSNRFNILGGFKPFSNVKSRASIKIAFSNAFSRPPAFVISSNRPNIKLWYTDLSNKGVTFHVVSTDNKPQTGYVTWIAMGPKV